MSAHDSNATLQTAEDLLLKAKAAIEAINIEVLEKLVSDVKPAKIEGVEQIGRNVMLVNSSTIFATREKNLDPAHYNTTRQVEHISAAIREAIKEPQKAIHFF